MSRGLGWLVRYPAKSLGNNVNHVRSFQKSFQRKKITTKSKHLEQATCFGLDRMHSNERHAYEAFQLARVKLDMMQMLQEKLWKTIEFANKRHHTIQLPTSPRGSFLNFV